VDQFNDRECHNCQDNHIEGYNVHNNSSINIRDWELEIKVLGMLIKRRDANKKGKSFELIIKSLLNELGYKDHTPYKTCAVFCV
jgi:hypothetical protein